MSDRFPEASAVLSSQTEPDQGKTTEKSEIGDFSFLDAVPVVTEYTAHAGKPLPDGEKPAIRKDIIPYFGQVVDPEIGMDVMELGLVYALDVDEKGNVYGEMTVTAPGCMFADSMLQDAADSLAMAKGVGEVTIKLVWDPPWDFAMISDQAKLDLDLM